MAIEDILDLMRGTMRAKRKEKKERVVKAQFFIRRQPIPEPARAELQRRRVPLEKVLGVGDELLVVVPDKETAYLVLGRGKEADVKPCWRFNREGLEGPDLRVSRRHAAIRIAFAGVEIFDLDSTNGVFCGNQRVKRTGILQLDAEVKLGPSVMIKYLGKEALPTDKERKTITVKRFVRVR